MILLKYSKILIKTLIIGSFITIFNCIDEKNVIVTKKNWRDKYPKSHNNKYNYENYLNNNKYNYENYLNNNKYNYENHLNNSKKALDQYNPNDITSLNNILQSLNSIHKEIRSGSISPDKVSLFYENNAKYAIDKNYADDEVMSLLLEHPFSTLKPKEYQLLYTNIAKYIIDNNKEDCSTKLPTIRDLQNKVGRRIDDNGIRSVYEGIAKYAIETGNINKIINLLEDIDIDVYKENKLFHKNIVKHAIDKGNIDIATLLIKESCQKSTVPELNAKDLYESISEYTIDNCKINDSILLLRESFGILSNFAYARLCNNIVKYTIDKNKINDALLLLEELKKELDDTHIYFLYKNTLKHALDKCQFKDFIIFLEKICETLNNQSTMVIYMDFIEHMIDKYIYTDLLIVKVVKEVFLLLQKSYERLKNRDSDIEDIKKLEKLYEHISYYAIIKDKKDLAVEICKYGIEHLKDQYKEEYAKELYKYVIWNFKSEKLKENQNNSYYINILENNYPQYKNTNTK